jgi:excisionase family DNA binding protein
MNNKLLISMTIFEFKCEIEDLIQEAFIKQINNSPQSIKEPEFISRKQVCSLLSISYPTLNKYVKTGDIPAKRIGNKILFAKSEVENSLKNIKTIKNINKL